MASVLGRLEERECAARKRVEELQAEPEAARSEWDEWLIARRRVGEVWDDRGGTQAGRGCRPRNWSRSISRSWTCWPNAVLLAASH
ncbi:hypothetical protein [Streptomyces cyaneus]|uniref:hypothetical protein n=1 Tax=Streptomyces cyaneus TaxID=1904 RepID=UPI001FE713EF|nr:hypothetical protein [Streptomyces cyaneus]